jgi:hypothetical protein
MLLLFRLFDSTAVAFEMIRMLVVEMSNGFFGDHWGPLVSKQGTQGLLLLSPLLS